MESMSNLTNMTPLLVFGITGGVIGIFVLIFGISIARSRRQVAESASWPATGGRILQSEVVYRHDSDSGAYYPQVFYEYQINGQTYRNSRIRFGMQMGFGAASVSQRVVSKYPVGTIQPVYFNPADPTQSVLDRSTGGANTVLGCVIAGLVVTMIFVVGIVFVSFYGSQMLQQAIKGFLPQ
jgi:hypothetical protein